MMLMATNATIQGKRVWLEVPDEKEGATVVGYVNYHLEAGLGLHIQHDNKLPQRENIEYAVPEGPSPVQRQKWEV
jgi:hypothetical protein